MHDKHDSTRRFGPRGAGVRGLPPGLSAWQRSMRRCTALGDPSALTIADIGAGIGNLVAALRTAVRAKVVADRAPNASACVRAQADLHPNVCVARREPRSKGPDFPDNASVDLVVDRVPGVPAGLRRRGGMGCSSFCGGSARRRVALLAVRARRPRSVHERLW